MPRVTVLRTASTATHLLVSRLHRSWLRSILAAVFLTGPLASATFAQSCPADCDGDGRVAVHELILAINVALGAAEQTHCPAADADRNGATSIDELVDGVARSLSGCFPRRGHDAVDVATRVAETTRKTLAMFAAVHGGEFFAGGDTPFRVARTQPNAESQPALAGEGEGPQPCRSGDNGSGTILTTCDPATNTRTTTYAQCRMPNEDEGILQNGIVRRTVVVPTDPAFDFCAPDAQIPDSAIVTLVLQDYSEISSDGGIRLANLSQTFEPTGPVCRLEWPEQVFPNGTLTTNGVLRTFCNTYGSYRTNCDGALGELDLTATDLVLGQTYSGPACDLALDVTGKLLVDNASTAERFALAFLGLTIDESALAIDRSNLSLNGRLLVDCLGEVEYATLTDLYIEEEDPCPWRGSLRIVIRDPSSAALTEPNQTRTTSSAPGDPSVSGGLHDLAYRAVNGPVYQVLQNPAADPALQTEDVRITTVVGSTDGISQCSTLSTSQTATQAVVSAASGLALPVEKVFVSEIFAGAARPCFNPNGRNGDGLLCFGAGCTSADCRCQGEDCATFSLTDLTPLASSSLQGRLVESLEPSDPPCNAGGRSTYAFGTDTPAIDPGQCAARPDDGFDLPPRRSIVFAYDAPPTSGFTAGAAGFSIDVDGDSPRCGAAGSVVTGVATRNERGGPVVTFGFGPVGFDVNDDQIVERSVYCQSPYLAAAQCGAPPPTPEPTPMPPPNLPCPELSGILSQGSTADAFNRLGGATCGDGGNSSPERSFLYRAPEAGCYRIDTYGPNFTLDTLLYVRGGETCQGPEIACNDNVSEATPHSVVYVDFERDDTAVIVVDGSAGTKGDFQLNVARKADSCLHFATPTVTATSTVDLTPSPTPTATRTPTITPTPMSAPENVWVSNGPYGARVAALAIDPASPQTLYAAAGQAGVFKSTNGGQQWRAANSGLTNTSVSALAIDPVDPRTLYAGTAGGVFKSTNGGETWSAANNGLPIAIVGKLAIDATDPRTLYATAGGTLFKTSDGAESWSTTGQIGVDALAVDPTSPRTVYVVRDGSNVYKSTDGGRSWNILAEYFYPGATARTLAVDPTNARTLYAGMNSIGVYKSADGGETWNAANNGMTNRTVVALVFDPSNPQTLYAGTLNGGVFKSTDGAESWSAANGDLTDMTALALAIDPTDPQTLYAGTSLAGVFKSTNGGELWGEAKNGLTSFLITELAIDPSNPLALYAATIDGGVFKSANGGGNWGPRSRGLIGPGTFALAIDPSNPQTLYAGTTGRAGVFKSTDGGENWSESGNGLSRLLIISALAIDPTNPHTLYAGAVDGGVYKSTNSARGWDAANSGLPSSPVTTLAIDPTNAQTVYAGTSRGGVLKTTNGGGSWSPANSGLTTQDVNQLAIDPADPQTLYAATNDSGVFKSTNGAESWGAANSGLTSQDVNALAIDPAQPQTLYAATNGGGVFTSTNGGESWTAMNNGLTSLLVYALAIDPLIPRTLYAGTSSGGVFRINQQP